MQREQYNLEYKEQLSKTYLKTVSAYANYNDGEIIFGIKDDGTVIGLDDPKQIVLNIENQINDNIYPVPDYKLTINEDNTIILKVFKGEFTPYEYNHRVYKRSDSSTVEVSKFEQKKLVLYGLNLNFEELNVDEKLTFNYLSNVFKEKLNLNNFNIDILKTLGLYTENNGFNIAALIFSDQNTLPGIKIIIYGENDNIIHNRYDLSNMSILEQFKKTIEIFSSKYCYEVIDGVERKQVENISLTAFREALANSIVHRELDINASIKIEMYKDKVSVSSPGGLLYPYTKDNYVNGTYSILRNPLIAEVFHRLGYIEKFGTGIKRIKKQYNNSIEKPVFDVSDSSITITLPSYNSTRLTVKEKFLLDSMVQNELYSRSELENLTGLNKFTLLELLNALLDKNLVNKEGTNRSTKYFKI